MRTNVRLPASPDVAIARLQSLTDRDCPMGDPVVSDVMAAASVRRAVSPLRLTPLDATEGFRRILRGEPPDDEMALSDMQWHEEAGRQETDGQAYGLRTLDESERASMLSRAHEFTKEHLAVILVIVVVAAVFTASQLLRTRSTEVPLNPPTVVVSGSAEPAPLSTPELIQVHVLGAVVSPGVVALPVGARVHEAIAACGGLAEEADPAELNLAAVLSDGAQVIIGVKGAPQGDVLAPNGAGMGAGESSGARINLNTASSAQLETLPGVGPVMAGRIIAWREQHGKFTTTAELQEVSGIGAKTYTQLEPYVCV